MKKLLLVISIFTALNLLFEINKCSAQWIATNFPADLNAYEIVKCGSGVFAATYGYGVYKSTDNGMNWFSSGMDNQYVMALEVVGSYILTGTDGYGIYISSDNGTIWVQSSLASVYINIIFAAGTNIFAGTDAAGIYRSADGGFNWSQTALTVTSVYSFAANESYLFAGGNMRVRRSSDNGASYFITMVGTGWIYSLAVIGPYLFAGVVSDATGVYVTTNNGTNWTQTSLNNKRVSTLTACGTNLLAGVAQYGVGLSTDYGASWVQKNEGLPEIPYFTNLYEAGDYLFIVTSNAAVPVWRRLKSNIFPSNAPVLISPENNSVTDTRTPLLTWGGISGASYYNLKVSTDAGFVTTVIDLNNITDTFYNVPAAILQDSAAYFWKVSAGAGGWCDAWQFSILVPITPQYTIEKVGSLTDDVNDLLSGGVISSENAEMLLSKLNNSVIQINLLHYEIAINRIEQFIFEVNLLRGKNILTETQANALLASANEIIYMLNILNLGDNPQNNPLQAKQFSLEQNYPNPFNPVTKIKFDLPKSSYTKLSVYDVLGREIAVLVNDQFKTGTYEVEWDASNYSSGVYFYKLASSTFVETKKMILLK